MLTLFACLLLACRPPGKTLTAHIIKEIGWEVSDRDAHTHPEHNKSNWRCVVETNRYPWFPPKANKPHYVHALIYFHKFWNYLNWFSSNFPEKHIKIWIRKYFGFGRGGVAERKINALNKCNRCCCYKRREINIFPSHKNFNWICFWMISSNIVDFLSK